MGRLLDDASHTGHSIHVDARLGAAHVDAGAHQLRLGQRLRNGSQQQLVALAEALLHQSGVPADKVDAAGVGRPIQCHGEGHVVLGVAAPRHQRHGRHGDALVDDGDTELALDVLTGAYQLLRAAADLVINFPAAAIRVLADAVQQGDAHSDGADVQMLLVDHVDGIENILQTQHVASLFFYSLCMASKMSSLWMRTDSPRPSPYSFRAVRSLSKGS